MSNLEQVISEHTISEARLLTLKKADSLGADVDVLVQLRDAVRVKSNSRTIVLPPNRLEGLSRGKGWARLGIRNNVQWGDRVEGGYCVGPGRWTVGGNDGFSRKKEDIWDVKNVKVGSEVWTIAS